MVTANKVASSGLSGKFQKVQHVCESGGEATPTTSTKLVELVLESVVTKGRNATLSKQNTGIEARLVEVHVFKSTMRKQLVCE